jgi:hypothetical protein
VYKTHQEVIHVGKNASSHLPNESAEVAPKSNTKKKEKCKKKKCKNIKLNARETK